MLLGAMQQFAQAPRNKWETTTEHTWTPLCFMTRKVNMVLLGDCCPRIQDSLWTWA